MKAWIVAADDPAAAPFNWAAGYRFDDRTPHHNQISIGDLFFFRDKVGLTAVARVSTLTLREDARLVERCPTCGSSELGARTRRKAKFRCALGHEFADAATGTRQATVYTAGFGVDYTSVAAEVTNDELRYFELTNSAQLAVRPCDVDGVTRLLSRRDPAVVALIKDWIADGSFELSDCDADRRSLGLFMDYRERVRAGIRLRRGDEDFRQKLFARYGERCMISGCAVPGLIEAAYVLPRTAFRLSRPGNGILLRSDLHTLFDLNLIGINPDDLLVAIHPKLAGTEYQQFAGVPLATAGAKAPSIRALELRWRDFQANLSKPALINAAGANTSVSDAPASEAGADHFPRQAAGHWRRDATV